MSKFYVVSGDMREIIDDGVVRHRPFESQFRNAAITAISRWNRCGEGQLAELTRVSERGFESECKGDYLMLTSGILKQLGLI